MNVFDSKTYQEYLREQLQWGISRKQGNIKKLAVHVKCHPTYVSQILNDKAHFSNEQALRCCDFFALSEDEAEFFLDLMNRDKAGDTKTKEHFQKRLDRKLSDRLDMKKRWKLAETFTAEDELKYYESWIPQTIHILCQLPGYNTVEKIASALRLSHHTVSQTMKNLESLGLIEFMQGHYSCVKESAHLGKTSPSIVKLHTNWRLKTVNTLSETGGFQGTHYSSVVSLSKAAVAEVNRLIYQHIEETRAVIIPTPSELLYCYTLDFYPLISEVSS